MSKKDFKGGFAYYSQTGEPIPEDVKRALFLRAKQKPGTTRHLTKAIGSDDFQIVAKANRLVQGSNPDESRRLYNQSLLKKRKGEATDLDLQIIRIWKAKDETAANRSEPNDTPDWIIQTWSRQCSDWLALNDRPHFWEWYADYLGKVTGLRLKAATIKKAAQRLELKMPRD